LEFIDENRQRSFRLLRGGASRFEQRLQIVLEIAVIGETGFRVEIEADFDIGVFHFQRLGESGKCAQRPLCESLHLLVTR